jgi:hypothetical protein
LIKWYVSSLPQLFVSFFKLGATAFGGPAMVPYIGKLAVEQKRWINDQTFRDGVLFAKQFLEHRRFKPPVLSDSERVGSAAPPPVLLASGFPLFFSWLDFQPSMDGRMRYQR